MSSYNWSIAMGFNLYHSMWVNSLESIQLVISSGSLFPDWKALYSYHSGRAVIVV